MLPQTKDQGSENNDGPAEAFVTDRLDNADAAKDSPVCQPLGDLSVFPFLAQPMGVFGL